MIYLGDNELLGVKLGNDDIAGIYVGDNLIYPTTVTAWSVSPTSIAAESGSSTERIKIAALDSWTITSNKSWITFSQNSGDSGRTTVIATIAQNDTMDRTATITIAGGDGYIATISVSQEAAPYENQYLTVEALESGNFDIGAIWPAYVSQGLSNLGAYYSLNEGAWTAIPDTGTTIQGVSVGDRIRIKAQNVYGIGAGLFRPAGDTPVSIRFNAYGNVMSALYGDNFAGQDTFPTNMLIGTAGALDSSFYSTNVVDASNLIMPATALTWGCYMNMFLNCPNLTGAPELPAETLADHSYQGMFRGCSSLNYIKCLATDISATDCTSYWVENVASAGTFVKSHSMSGWTTGDNGIPTGWEVEDDTIPYDQQYLTFEILSAGTIEWQKTSHNAETKTISYSKDNGNTWTNIASTGVSFNVDAGDKVLFKGENARYAISDGWYNRFTGTAIFNVYGNIMSLIGGDNFSGLTALYSGYTFTSLFRGANVYDASNLVLAADILSEWCYKSMFEGSRLVVPPSILPATTLATRCYYGMFLGTSITTAPVLPATTLKSNCYDVMFQNCTSLNYIKCLATNISASGCTNNWVNGVSSTGTFVKAAGMTGWSTGVNGIPNNWTVEDVS